MEACSFIAWCALKPEVQAAWTQAVLSVLAILVAALLPLWQQRQQRIGRIRNHLELMLVAGFLAERAHLDVIGQPNLPDLKPTPEEFAVVAAALSAVPFHDLPHHALAYYLQLFASSVRDLGAQHGTAMAFGKGSKAGEDAAKRVEQINEALKIAFEEVRKQVGVKLGSRKG